MVDKKINLGSDNKFADWTLPSDFQIVKLIGKGSYGDVVEALHIPTSKKVAIKKIYKVFDDLVDFKRILREIVLLRKLKHPNIVALYDILPPQNADSFNDLYLIMEYCQSDLKKLSKSAVHLEMVHVQAIIYSILTALKFMHSAEVLHRDVKPANVLINEDCTAKLCDFGLARSVAGLETSFKKLVLESKPKMEASAIEKVQAVSSNPPQKVAEEIKKKEVSKFLKKTNEMRKNMKRELTGHVVTRWYRAPELILLEKEYGDAIDVWSAGCIFAELLSMIKENTPTYLDRKPLFPGDSCFPLSPNHKVKLNKQGFPNSNTDQLSVIFDVIGTPTEDEMAFVTDAKALEYLKTFTKRDRKDLSSQYPAAGKEGIDLLVKMLSFNPFMRPSVSDCIEHPFLEKSRDKVKELKANAPATVEFESEKELTEEQLRGLFLKEVEYYKQNKHSF